MRYAIFSLAILLFFSSCKNNLNNSLTVYRLAEEGFQRSNKNISIANDVIYQGCKAKLQDESLKEIAADWFPRVMLIKNLSDTMVRYINGLKEELKSEAGGNDPKNKNWENTRGVSEHLFESHSKGKELLKALIEYKAALLAVDPGIKRQFESTINVFSSEFTFTSDDTTTFTKIFFKDIPVVATDVVLSRFINNVKICENEIATYCYNNIGIIDDSGMFDKFSAIIVQSSTYLKAGEELEINAGVGSFSTAAQPKVTIDGNFIPGNEDGIAVYKFKTPLKAGKYSKTVKIEHYRPDGTKESMTKNIEYTVIEEK
jgi:hypothetical protein